MGKEEKTKGTKVNSTSILLCCLKNNLSNLCSNLYSKARHLVMFIIDLFFPQFSRHLLSTCFMAGTTLDTGWNTTQTWIKYPLLFSKQLGCERVLAGWTDRWGSVPKPRLLSNRSIEHGTVWYQTAVRMVPLVLCIVVTLMTWLGPCVF